VGMSGFNTRAYGEDNYSAARRGEDTSRLESHLESQMEGLHAEDHPELTNMIKSAQAAEESQKEEFEKEWLAAQADGTVARMKGEPDINALVIPNNQDNEIDALRKLRLAQMKGAAAEKKRWQELGHGAYQQLESEAAFLEALPKHERAVCAIVEQGSIDAELLHVHMRALCGAHVETFFCWLDAQSAPMMMGMVEVGRLPALLLCRKGQVVDHMHGLDRSFTAEGVAYELGKRGLVDFEEGVKYGSSKGGCTTATAGRVHRTDDDADIDDDDVDIDE